MNSITLFRKAGDIQTTHLHNSRLSFADTAQWIYSVSVERHSNTMSAHFLGISRSDIVSAVTTQTLHKECTQSCPSVIRIPRESKQFWNYSPLLPPGVRQFLRTAPSKIHLTTYPFTKQRTLRIVSVVFNPSSQQMKNWYSLRRK